MLGFDTKYDFLVKATGKKIAVDHIATNFWSLASSAFNYNDFSNKARCIGNQNAHFYMLDYVR